MRVRSRALEQQRNHDRSNTGHDRRREPDNCRSELQTSGREVQFRLAVVEPRRRVFDSSAFQVGTHFDALLDS